MRPRGLVSPDALRARFAAALAKMYRAEVPRFGALADLVAAVDAEALAKVPDLKRDAGGRLDGAERHGAIRVGTAEELSGLRRLFAVMGMEPVGYYDLSIAGLPVHSTAFRPTGEAALRTNPFRMFCSLLRLDLIEDAELRQNASSILRQRHLFSPRCLELVRLAEAEGGVTENHARELVHEAYQIFRWRSEAAVSTKAYRTLHKAHPLIADIVAFKGPHINHLTLATLDIDAAQREMARRGLNSKAIVEGPPRRTFPILLRQTSFKALPEPVTFQAADGSREVGMHCAHFGEIEQRGIALTAKGRALYDRLLAEVLAAVPPAADGSNADLYQEALAREFAAFPDDHDRLREEDLAFHRYRPTRDGLRHAGDPSLPATIDALLQGGYVEAEPLLYEDFLPVSAAGIFRSNLGEMHEGTLAGGAGRAAFEEALGAAVIDETALYAQTEAQSKAASLKALGIGSNANLS